MIFFYKFIFNIYIIAQIIRRRWFENNDEIDQHHNETGEWPKGFTEVTMIALKKKPQATKCSNHRTISLIAHTAKIVAKILRRRIEKKIEDVLREDQFGFRIGKGTSDAIGMLRIISELTLEIDEELSVCFIDLQKAFDRVNWTKLMQIIKEIVIDWR